MKAKLLFYYDHCFKFTNRNNGFIFKVNEYQCKHVFLNSNLEESVSTYVFVKSF